MGDYEATITNTMETPESVTWVHSKTPQSDTKSGIAIHTDLILAIIYYSIGTVGIVGNGLVIVFLWKAKSVLKGTVKWLVVHQSLIDMVAALILILTTAFQNLGDLVPGTAGILQCKLWLTKLFLWSTLLSSTLNLCCITAERYTAIVTPLNHRFRSHRKIIFAFSVVIIWTLPIIYNAFKITTTVIVNDRCLVYGNWPSQKARRSVGILTLFVQFLIPLIFLVFCYSKMLYALSKSSNLVHPENNGAHNTSRLRSRKRAIKTLALVSVMFFICWVWNQMYFFALNIGVKLDFANPFYHFTVVAVFSSCCVNPFIYLFKYMSSIKKYVQRSGTVTQDVSATGTPLSAANPMRINVQPSTLTLPGPEVTMY